MCPGLWIGFLLLPGARWPERLPSPWKQVQGLLLRSRANFRPIDGRWSMNGARCGSEGARGVCRVVHNGKRQSYKTPGGAFEAVVHRLSACYVARTRRQQEKARRPSPSALRESRVLVTMEGGNELNHAYECCRTYHTTSAPRATDRYARSRVVGALYKRTLKPAADGSAGRPSPSRAFVEHWTR